MKKNKKQEVFQVDLAAMRESMGRLGLLSTHLDNVTETQAKLSQPRGCLVMLRELFAERQEATFVTLCDSGIETLTEMIGDDFKP